MPYRYAFMLMTLCSPSLSLNSLSARPYRYRKHPQDIGLAVLTAFRLCRIDTQIKWICQKLTCCLNSLSAMPYRYKVSWINYRQKPVLTAFRLCRIDTVTAPTCPNQNGLNSLSAMPYRYQRLMMDMNIMKS